jgi:hypothetical protein
LNGKDSGSFPAVGKSSAIIPALQCTATGVYCTFIGSAAPAYLGTVRKKKQKKGKEKKGIEKEGRKIEKKLSIF